MDYCSSCRRHLNGALVCPGCGAYAPDIAPPAHLLHGADADSAPEISAETPAEIPAGMSADAAAAPGPDAARAEGTSPTGQGRAARRRQLARWKKHRRRAVAATAVALVGGGLTLAALPASRPTTSHTHAAPPPEPVNASATPRAAATDSASEQPGIRDAQDPGNARPAGTNGRQQNSATTTPPSTANGRQAETAAAAQAPAPRSAKPHLAPQSAARSSDGTGPGNAEASAPAPAPAAPEAQDPAPAPAPEATASAERPGVVGTLVGGLLPTAPADEPESAHVCVIGVCLG
ncbi:SCO2400 family protein [Streptomyces sp. NPDC055287]